MAKKAAKKKPIRPVTSAEEKHERAELARYRASLRRIQETERLAKQLRRMKQRVEDELVGLARTIAADFGFLFTPLSGEAGEAEK